MDKCTTAQGQSQHLSAGRVSTVGAIDSSAAHPEAAAGGQVGHVGGKGGQCCRIRLVHAVAFRRVEWLLSRQEKVIDLHRKARKMSAAPDQLSIEGVPRSERLC